MSIAPESGTRSGRGWGYPIRPRIPRPDPTRPYLLLASRDGSFLDHQIQNRYVTNARAIRALDLAC